MSHPGRPPSPLSRLRLYTLQTDMVRPRKYRTRKSPKMELFRRRAPDYTELAYREAVAKLKYLLAESYTPVSVHKPRTVVMAAEREGAGEPEVYPLEQTSLRPRFAAEVPPFLRRQEEYIDQLEKEGQLYREELSRVLDRVRDVDTRQQPSEEDESDRELKVSSRRGRGPSIVYSSRISELEAQLTQVRLELRKAQDEASYLKAHSKPIQAPVSQQSIQQLESLQRERDDLNERVSSLQTLVGQLRDKEASATSKAKRSLDVVDQAQYDKNQLEMEVRRLKSELERMSDKQREALQDSARRVSEAERRYTMQIERLNGDLAAQWDAANRLNLELDRARRTEAELRRELAQKIGTVEELKKELLTKTGSLQNEALTASEEREKLESELSSCRLSVERAERQSRQETARMQAEIQALRSRLDRADQDLLHSRKENIRLADIIAGLEKELTLSQLTKDSAASKELKKADELTSMIKEMDAKHEESKTELENLIQSQSQLMEKLNAECQALTRRLEDSSARHKEEMASLQNNLEYISSKLEAPDHYRNQEWRDEEKLAYEDHIEAEKSIPEHVEKVDDTKYNHSEDQMAAGSHLPTGGNNKKEINKKENGKPEENQARSEYKSPNDSKEEYAKKPTVDYKKNESYNGSAASVQPETAYDQQKTYEHPETAYDQQKTYEQPETAYDQQKTYEQPETAYDQQKTYEQPETAYDANQTYNTSKTKDYEQKDYSTLQSEGYDQGQPYDQQAAEEYAKESGYDHDGVYEGQGYEQGQDYSQGGSAYEQGQAYDQGDAAYQQGYDEGQIYDQSNVQYDQSNVQYDQNYDPTGSTYEQGPYAQGEGYEQGQVYTGTGEVYQPEGYVETAANQGYQEKDPESEYAYKEKS